MKAKEIEASNATDQDKLIAKNKAEEVANSIINNINKATSNQAVSQVQTAGNHAIEQVHTSMKYQKQKLMPIKTLISKFKH